MGGENLSQFDPEKVERFFPQTGIPEFDDEFCVSSSDYDALLALYRELQSEVEYWKKKADPYEHARTHS